MCPCFFEGLFEFLTLQAPKLPCYSVLQQIDGRAKILHRERSRPEQTRGGATEGDEIARVSLQVHHPLSHPLCSVSIKYDLQNNI